ncbi:long-chain fatty acid--CoA ligase [Oceanispirochaeta crateris]|uniref:Long-chain fatty acid--CoA ligase n=1 Tax=Oceanispirochaeta crateris TaxID=2518645 RepID=A0A5C1QHZ0_9SPIO|nr:AMP-binding protein [Oceanispirochaeta crateris]QEN07137.1 long-chain fatty acid--CoA ligase [Oceanispirochaeta crateris]
MESTIMKQLQKVVKTFPDQCAQLSKDADGVFQETDYKTFYREVQFCAAGFQSIGIQRGDTVGIIADNRKEWLICDMGLLSLGANDAPRGCDINSKILAHIVSIPQCGTVILENSMQLDKVLEVQDELPELKKIIMIEPGDAESRSKASRFTLYQYSDLMKTGEEIIQSQPDLIEKEIALGQEDDIATIIFTSGTTGIPKGVMLTNKSYIYQSEAMLDSIPVSENDTWLTILPVWHSFERIIQYVSCLNGACLAYSKPVGKTLLMDLQAVKPTLMTAVPRLWEALYAGVLRNIKEKGEKAEKLFRFFLKKAIQDEHYRCVIEDRYPDYTGQSTALKKIAAHTGRLATRPLRTLGDKILFSKIIDKMFPCLRAGISGGGALQRDVDNFFAGVGVKVLEGYGLTESGPVISVRKESHPVVNTVGPAFIGTEIKVLDKNGAEVKSGERGVLHVRGPQVMKGYYGNQELTDTVLTSDGWLDTGDIAIISLNNEITLVGRAKDTIVLLGGENVEPVPLESKIKESPYIDNAVVLGQDKKYLSAIIIPNFDTMEEYAKKNNIMYENRTLLGDVPELKELINQEIADLVCPANGFSSFERIYQFSILHNSFEVGKELSAKMELLRPKIYDLYKAEIDSLLSR